MGFLYFVEYKKLIKNNFTSHLLLKHQLLFYWGSFTIKT